ncbi:MAG: acyloxyacyl hydrolase [Alphaproteobacteria bacterium]
MVGRRVLRIVTGVALAALASAPALAGDAGAAKSDPGLLVLGAGAYDFHDDHAAAEVNIAYRFGTMVWLVKPHVGAMVTSNGAKFGWGGLLLDFELTPNWMVTPSTSVGVYSRGSGKDLGYSLEFRSGVDVAYRFDDNTRLGLGVYHISNAGLGRKNPGEESIIATYALPVGVLLGK